MGSVLLKMDQFWLKMPSVFPKTAFFSGTAEVWGGSPPMGGKIGSGGLGDVLEKIGLLLRPLQKFRLLFQLLLHPGTPPRRNLPDRW